MRSKKVLRDLNDSSEHKLQIEIMSGSSGEREDIEGIVQTLMGNREEIDFLEKSVNAFEIDSKLVGKAEEAHTHGDLSEIDHKHKSYAEVEHPHPDLSSKNHSSSGQTTGIL